MSDFKPCPVCKEYAYLNAIGLLRHTCKPEWECRLSWHEGDDEWYTVHASDPEAAAEKYAEEYDSTGGEYAIVGGRGRECFVDVRKAGFDDDDQPHHHERFAIEAETVPSYRAHKTA